MKFEMNVVMDNAAFTDNNGGELARILRKLADRLEGGDYFDDDESGLCMDANGNRVGGWTINKDN